MKTKVNAPASYYSGLALEVHVVGEVRFSEGERPAWACKAKRTEDAALLR